MWQILKLFSLIIILLLTTPLHAQWQVAVFPHENRTADPQWDWFSRGISEAAVHAYHRIPRIRVIDEEPLKNALGDAWPDLLGNPTLSDRVQIHLVLRGEYTLKNGHITLRTDIMEAHSGAIRRTVITETSVHTPLNALHPLLFALFEVLNVPLEPTAKTALSQSIAFQPDAFRITIDAVRAFRLAIRQSPPDPGLLTQAENGLNRAIARDPKSPLSHHYLGRIAEARDHMPDAERAYRAALRADFEHVASRHRLALVLKNQGNLSEALSEFEQALRQSPIDFAIQADMSDIFFNQYAQTFEAMTAQLRELVQANPDDPLAHYELGSAYDELYRFEEAADHYQQALQRDSTLADAHFKLGLIHRRKDRLEDAIHHLQRAIEYRTQFVRVHVRLGEMLYLLARYDQAAEQFAQALQAEPNYLIPRYHLGMSLLALGRENDALSAFRQYAEGTVDDYRPYVEIADIHHSQGDIAQAIAACEKALAINPLHIPSRHRLAYLYASGQNFADAARHLRAILDLQPDHPDADALRRDLAQWEKSRP